MTQSDVKRPKLLTLRQACDMLGCHPNTLREWDRKGYLVAIRIGIRRDRRYKRGDIQKLMKKTRRSTL